MTLSSARIRALFMLVMLAYLACLPAGLQAAGGGGRAPHGMAFAANSVLSHMDGAAKRLRTVSAHLTYTTVTVLVNDRASQAGELFFRKSKSPEVLIEFSKPNAKTILFKKNRGEIYYPETNQIQEYDLERHSDLLQQFLLLGFGTESAQLEASYNVQYLGEKALGGMKTPVLELKPTHPDVAAQLSKVDLWISPESWLPVQQEFFEASGDYMIAQYSHVRVNVPLASSVFKIRAKRGAERMKMN